MMSIFQRVFELMVKMLWKNCRWSYMWNSYRINSYFYTCHDSWAILIRSKLRPDGILEIKVQAKRFFLKILILSSWSLCEVSPEDPAGQEPSDLGWPDCTSTTGSRPEMGAANLHWQWTASAHQQHFLCCVVGTGWPPNAKRSWLCLVLCWLQTEVNRAPDIFNFLITVTNVACQGTLERN